MIPTSPEDKPDSNRSKGSFFSRHDDPQGGISNHVSIEGNSLIGRNFCKNMDGKYVRFDQLINQLIDKCGYTDKSISPEN